MASHLKASGVQFKAGPEGNNRKDSGSLSDKVKLWAAILTWMDTTQYPSKEVARIHRQHDKVVMRPTGLLAHTDHSTVTLI